MRFDVYKYLIWGPASVKEHFFRRVQELGIAEFMGTHAPAGQKPAEIQVFIDALHVLRRMVPVKQTIKEDVHSANVVARHVVELNMRLETLREKARVLDKEIERVAIFGDFSLSRLREIEQSSQRRIQFFCAKSEAIVAAKSDDEVLYVGSQTGIDYYVAINKEPRNYEGFVEIVIERPVGELQEELAQTVRAIDACEIELGVLTHRKKFLQKGLIDALNQYHLQESKKTTAALLEGELFATECWVPQNKVAQLQSLADQCTLHVEPIKIEEKDRRPTYLENKGAAELGQDLVNIYDIPSTRDRDPSGWVFFAFALFFSMIVADAGYGLILLGISLYLFFKFGKQRGLGRRVILLSCSLSIGCIFWGVMTTSFLGIDFPVDSPLRSISVVNWMVEKKAAYVVKTKNALYDEFVKQVPALAKVSNGHEFLFQGVKEQDGKKKYVVYNTFTDNVMMELVIFIGALHIILSFLRYLDRNWAGLGWIVFMVGSYLYFPLVLKATSLIHYLFAVPYEGGGTVGLYLIFGGLLLASLLAVIQNKMAGLGEVMQVIGVFADVMSYLRIYALSLAGMIMGSTFNHIGTSMPLYFGIFIILAGHTINFTLALMGGLIHGLRLNFIEWYHYSFEGGGRNFSPLSLLKIN